ncbi:putative inorganic phosphate cotransporter isoform X2 [Eurosta solidaginis]
MLYSIAINSLLSLLIPLSVGLGDWPLLCTLRFGQGLAQSVVLPAIATIMSKWEPIEERSAIQTFIYCGSKLGLVVMLAVSGKLCSSSWGWPSTFYLPGALGLLLSALWFVYGTNTAPDCKHISARGAMNEESLIQIEKEKKKQKEAESTPMTVPWRSICTSIPFLVLLANHYAYDWFFWMLLTQMPTYIKNVLGKDIESNALISALPYLCLLSLSLLLCPFANWLERSKLLHATVSRKIYNTIGFWIPAISLISLGYLQRDEADLAIGLLTATVGLSTAIYFGYALNHLDLAPNHAGTLIGIVNCLSSTMGIVAPLVVGFIVTDTSNIYQWRTVFFLSSAIAFVGNLLFLLFGTAKVQSWNEAPRTRTLSESEQMEQLFETNSKVIIPNVTTYKKYNFPSLP